MKLVYIEDEKYFAEQTKDFIENYAEKKHQTICMTLYESAEMLEYDLQEGICYDLYLLDIQLHSEDINGLKLAGEIRNADTHARIVFLTSYPEYALDGYESNPFHFILKDNLQKLEHVLDQIEVLEKKTRKNCLVLETKTRYEKLYYEDMVVVYKEGKNSVFVCRDGRKSSIRKPLCQVYENMDCFAMYMLGKSYIINLAYVDRIRGREIDLHDYGTIYVSQKSIHHVKTAVCAYWSECVICE